MFAYPHARSTYTLSKETDFCCLSFSFQNQASRSCQGESNSFADSTGTHSSRGSSLTSPRSERAPVCLWMGLNMYILADYVYYYFIIVFFCRLCSYFYLCYVFIFFPLFSPPPPWNESMAFPTESDSHRTLLALYWFLWTDIRTLHGGGGCKEEDDT